MQIGAEPQREAVSFAANGQTLLGGQIRKLDPKEIPSEMQAAPECDLTVLCVHHRETSIVGLSHLRVVFPQGSRTSFRCRRLKTCAHQV